MKRYEVRFRPQAEADLRALYDYIADEAGTAVADGYIDRIEALCRSLETFPHRGTRRDHIRAGLRMMGFERRATLVFEVGETDVRIIRVFYGGRDFERGWRDADQG